MLLGGFVHALQNLAVVGVGGVIDHKDHLVGFGGVFPLSGVDGIVQLLGRRQHPSPNFRADIFRVVEHIGNRCRGNIGVLCDVTPVGHRASSPVPPQLLSRFGINGAKAAKKQGFSRCFLTNHPGRRPRERLVKNK